MPGRFDVKIYPASQLGTIPRIVEVPPAFLTGVDPRYGVVTAPGVFDSLAHGQRTPHEVAARAGAGILPWSIAFNDRLYGIWSKTGGVLTRLSPEEQVEFRRPTSTVAEAVPCPKCSRPTRS